MKHLLKYALLSVLLLLSACGTNEQFPQKAIYFGRFSVNIPEYWKITGWSSGSFQDVVPIKSEPIDLSSLSTTEKQALLSSRWDFLTSYSSGAKIISRGEMAQSQSPAIAVTFRKEFIGRRGGSELRILKLDTICALYATPEGLVGLRTRDMAGTHQAKLTQKLNKVLATYRFGTPHSPSSQFFVTRKGYFDSPPKQAPEHADTLHLPAYDESYYCVLSGVILPGVPKSKIRCRVGTEVVAQPKPYDRRAGINRVLETIRSDERVANDMRGWEDCYIAEHQAPREGNPPYKTLICRWHFPGEAFSAKKPCIDISFETEDIESLNQILIIWDVIVDSLRPSSPFPKAGD